MRQSEVMCNDTVVFILMCSSLDLYIRADQCDEAVDLRVLANLKKLRKLSITVDDSSRMVASLFAQWPLLQQLELDVHKWEEMQGQPTFSTSLLQELKVTRNYYVMWEMVELLRDSLRQLKPRAPLTSFTYFVDEDDTSYLRDRGDDEETKQALEWHEDAVVDILFDHTQTLRTLTYITGWSPRPHQVSHEPVLLRRLCERQLLASSATKLELDKIFLDRAYCTAPKHHTVLMLEQHFRVEFFP